jgi:hypothetical protein
MIVENGNTGDPAQFTRNRQLARGRGAIDKDQFHPLIVAGAASGEKPNRGPL